MTKKHENDYNVTTNQDSHQVIKCGHNVKHKSTWRGATLYIPQTIEGIPQSEMYIPTYESTYTARAHVITTHQHTPGDGTSQRLTQYKYYDILSSQIQS